MEAQNNLGIAMAREGRLGAAIEHFQKAIAIKPDYAEAHNNLGIALLTNDVPDAVRAETEFKAAIAIKPHYADAQCNLGNLYGQQQKDKAAESLFRQAVESDSRFIKGYLSWANLLANEGRLSEADAVLGKAQAVAPGNTAIQNMQHQIDSQMGR